MAVRCLAQSAKSNTASASRRTGRLNTIGMAKPLRQGANRKGCGYSALGTIVTGRPAEFATFRETLPTRAASASSKKNYIRQKLSGACQDLISRITGARDIGCFEIVPVGDDRLCPSESVLRDDAARCGFAFEVSCSCKFFERVADRTGLAVS
jgi:hypothetical protein